jgi:hypothetical protein
MRRGDFTSKSGGVLSVAGGRRVCDLGTINAKGLREVKSQAAIEGDFEKFVGACLFSVECAERQSLANEVKGAVENRATVGERFPSALGEQYSNAQTVFLVAGITTR